MKTQPDLRPSFIFVYNADSGFAAALFDSAHKLISPQTYACNLCALTHGLIGPKKEWTNFLKSLPEQPMFLHRDEFKEKYPEQANVSLPAIFQIEGTQLTLLADGSVLNQVRTLAELTALVKK